MKCQLLAKSRGYLVKKMTYETLKDLISRSEERVSFGTAAQAPDPDWISAAETALAREFPESYKWFLNTFGGGHVFGEEIYSLYNPANAAISSGDVVQNTQRWASLGAIAEGEIAICMTNYGELFAIGSAKEQAEYPVYLYQDGKKTRYASSFAAFLEKFIQGT